MCLQCWFGHPLTHGAPEEDDHVPAKESSSASTIFSPSSKDISSMSASTSSRSLAEILVRNLPRGPVFYRHSEIAAATHRFHHSQKIGSSAWRGVLRGSHVAIVQKQGKANNFGKLLRKVSALHHVNLAKVMGGRTSSDCVFVAYELVDGDNLQSCLCNTVSPHYTVLSTWKLRMQVAMDVAKGMEYVHGHMFEQSAHKYLTSSNVMLMKGTLQAKLTLVGMALLTGEVSASRESVDEVGHGEDATLHAAGADEVAGASKRDACERKKRSVPSNSMKIRGTQGYMAPEYAQRGVISQKYDVFTFGIVLLELLKGEGIGTGNGQIKSMKASIVQEAQSIFSDEVGARGRLRLWIDRRLRDSYPVDDAMKVVSLALLCVHEDPDKRPIMREVAMHMTNYLKLAEIWDKSRSTYTGTGTLEPR